MITAASVAFGMYAKVEVRRPRAINTIVPRIQSYMPCYNSVKFDKIKHRCVVTEITFWLLKDFI
jgi:hypothetical protein